MKRILSAGLLILLLYNMFGLSVAVFFFEKDFQTATEVRGDDEFKLIKFPVVTLPYSTSWENTDDVAGLLKNDGKFYNVVHQKIENDTAYVVLKTNLSARDRFLELADQITNPDIDPSTESPLRKMVHSMMDLVKIYLVNLYQNIFICSNFLLYTSSLFGDRNTRCLSPFLSLLSPPPEY